MGDRLNIKISANSRATRAENAVYKTITEMQEADEEINFSAVAKKAGVSSNYLYTHSKLRAMIMELRNKPDAVRLDRKTIQEMDSMILYLENERLKRDLKELEEKIKDLETENSRLKRCFDLLNSEDKKDDKDIDLIGTSHIIVPF